MGLNGLDDLKNALPQSSNQHGRSRGNGQDRSAPIQNPGVHLDLQQQGVLPHPSHLPLGPLGEGETIPRSVNPRLVDGSQREISSSLSQRERAGVRVNGPVLRETGN